MKKIKYWMPVILTSIITGIWFLFANNLFMWIAQKNANIQIIADLGAFEKDVVYAGTGYDLIDVVDHNFGKVLHIQGFAYVQTEQSYDNKQVSVLLYNEQKKIGYLKEAHVSDIGNSEFLKRFSEQQRNTAGLKKGYGLVFDMLSIPNGTYRYYVYCRENDDDYGLYRSARLIIKRDNNHILIDDPFAVTEKSLKTDFQIVPEMESFKKDVIYAGYGYDTMEIKDTEFGKTLSFFGWAFVPTELPNVDKRISAILYDEKSRIGYMADATVYDASGTASFKEKFNLPGLYNGYVLHICLNNIPNGTYQYCLFCRENDHNYGLFCSDRFVIKRDNENILIEDPHA